MLAAAASTPSPWRPPPTPPPSLYAPYTWHCKQSEWSGRHRRSSCCVFIWWGRACRCTFTWETVAQLALWLQYPVFLLLRFCLTRSSSQRQATNRMAVGGPHHAFNMSCNAIESTEFTPVRDVMSCVPMIEYINTLPLMTEELAVRLGQALQRWLSNVFVQETRTVNFDQTAIERKGFRGTPQGCSQFSTTYA
eukprot:TRINITY_DN1946_c0_g2_i13.p1 TRINITY_DN1946_c0_g2~~TRINITY_DN1946_c0_g2_i13.p1  ORF type:complete len:193 (-),score=5.11 TRINITY_DN1946_c0_g2_i13:589-1167(-)